jgi:hypothetical protein
MSSSPLSPLASPRLFCTVCCKRASNTCRRCRLAPYCSIECQTKDWDQGPHETICRPKHTKEQVLLQDELYANISFGERGALRFAVGDVVICHVDHCFWGRGTVMRHNFSHDSETSGTSRHCVPPYQVRLINGRYITVANDVDECIMRHTRINWRSVHHDLPALVPVETIVPVDCCYCKRNNANGQPRRYRTCQGSTIEVVSCARCRSDKGLVACNSSKSP